MKRALAVGEDGNVWKERERERELEKVVFA